MISSVVGLGGGKNCFGISAHNCMPIIYGFVRKGETSRGKFHLCFIKVSVRFTLRDDFFPSLLCSNQLRAWRVFLKFHFSILQPFYSLSPPHPPRSAFLFILLQHKFAFKRTHLEQGPVIFKKDFSGLGSAMKMFEGMSSREGKWLFLYIWLFNSLKTREKGKKTPLINFIFISLTKKLKG